MPSTTYENIRSFWAQRAPWLTTFAQSCSALGTTTYLIDTAALTDPSNLGLSAKSLSNMWIFRPDATAAGDRKRSIGGNAGAPVDTTNARLYPKLAWTNAPAAAEQYEITAIDPQIMFNKLVESLEGFLIPQYSILPRFTDADMEAANVTSWTLSGAGARTKVTTAADVHTGSQSLFFDAGTAAESVKSVTVRVTPSTSYFASAIVRADAGTATFVIQDETNAAEIESGNRVSHSLERFCSMQRTFTTPAGCEEITLRVLVTGSTDDLYIAAFSGPNKASDTSINAPSTLSSNRYLRKLLVARYGQSITTGIYDAESRTWQEVPRGTFHLHAANHHANPYRIEMRDGHRLPMDELWVERLMRVADIVTLAWTAAGETSPTIPLEKALIGYDSLRRICEHILAYAPTDTEVQTTYKQIMDKGSEYSSLLRDFHSDLETPSYQEAPRRATLASL